MKSFLSAVFVIPAICLADENAIPWEKTASYGIGEGGTLMKAEVLSPVSSKYLGFNLPEPDGDKELLEKGYFAYRKTDSNLHPFTKVQEPLTKDIDKKLREFRSRHEGEDAATTTAPTLSTALTGCDTVQYYWRDFINTFSMTKGFGKIRFYTEGEEKGKPFTLNHSKALKFISVTGSMNHKGLLFATSQSEKEGNLEYSHYLINGMNGDVFPVKKKSKVAFYGNCTEWVSSNIVASCSSGRYGGGYSIIDIGGNMVAEGNMAVNQWGDGYLVADRELWTLDSDLPPIRVYPEPEPVKDAALEISVKAIPVDEDGTDEKWSMMKVTLRNNTDKPISFKNIPGFFYLKILDGHSGPLLCPLSFHNGYVGQGDSVPDEDEAQRWVFAQDDEEDNKTVTLQPGESRLFILVLEVVDHRTFPIGDGQMDVKITFIPDVSADSPVNGSFTCIGKIDNPFNRSDEAAVEKK